MGFRPVRRGEQEDPAPVVGLQEQDVLRRNGEGLIEFDDDIKSIGADARLVLGEEIRHSILSLAMPHEDSDEPDVTAESD